MHPRLRPLDDLKKIADNLAAHINQDADKSLTRGETIGVIFMLIVAVCSILFLALTR